MSQLSPIFKPNQNILITAHRDPDLDALGSCLALFHVLTRLGSHPVIWLQDSISRYQFMPGAEHVAAEIPSRQFDCIVFLDTADISRVKNHTLLIDLLSKIPTFNIDHHQDNTQFAKVNAVNPIASSVGEFLYDIFDQHNIELTPEIATCLYGAIAYDTGRFLFNNVTAHTFKVAAALIDSGANMQLIGQKLYESLTSADFELLNVALKNRVFSDKKKCVYTTIPKEFTDKGHLKVIDVIRQLEQAEISLVFWEKESSSIKISFRSKGRADVAALAAKFKGGGHKFAAGAIVHGALSTVVNAVLSEIE